MNIRTIKRLMPIFVALMFGVSLLGATNNLNLNSASNTKILQYVSSCADKLSEITEIGGFSVDCNMVEYQMDLSS